MRAAIYTRVSSDEMPHETYSLPEQLSKCYEHALSRGYELVGDRWADLSSGLEVVKNGDGWRFANHRTAVKAGASETGIEPVLCFVEDYTGKRVNRPAMDALRDYVEREGLDVLVPRDTQRFARKRHVAGFLKDWFHRFGVTIDYATQDFTRDAGGQAQEGMHEVFDEWEAEQLREKAIRGRRRSAKMGNILISQPPFGYNKIGRGKDARLEADPDDSKIVKLLFAWYAFGDETGKPLTLAAIAKRLTAMRIATSWDKLGKKKKRGFGVWSPSSVRTILRNRVYIGEWIYGRRRAVNERVTLTPDGRRAIVEVESSDPVSEDQWIVVKDPEKIPPIIGQELFDAAQERLAENKRNALRNCKRPYLLRGMLKCGTCGANMAVTPATGGYSYYRCGGKHWEKRKMGVERCPAKMLRQDWADRAVWEEIKNRLLDLDNLTTGLRGQQADAERELEPLKEQLAWVKDRLSQTETRIARALDLYLDGGYPKDWLDQQMDGEKQAKAELEKAMLDLSGRIEATRISDETIKTVEAFRAKAVRGLDKADFEHRRRLMEMLRVQGVVKVIDGDQVIAGSWLIPESDLIVNVTSATHCANYKSNNGLALTFVIPIKRVNARYPYCTQKADQGQAGIRE